MGKAVIYEKSGDIGRITLNNPEQGNPFSLDALRLTIDAFRQSGDAGDACVIYDARGKNFTFGADLKYAFELISRPELRSEAVEYLWSWQELTSVMMEHPGIIVVGYHGWVVGGGFEHTLACDVRIAAADTKIMMPELDMGIFFSNASTKILPRIIGEGRAKQCMLMGDIIKADGAFAMGLVSQVCQPGELGSLLQTYAEKIASKDRLALQYAKKLIGVAQEKSLDDLLYEEGRVMIETGKSDGARQRIETFLKMHK